MKRSHKLKSALGKSPIWMTLSILAGVGTIPLLLVSASAQQVANLHAQLDTDNSSPPTAAQGRSQLIRNGINLLNSQKFAEAEALFRQGLEKYPDDALLHYELGSTLYRQEKLEASIAEYQQAIRLNPRYAIAHNSLGIVFATQNRLDEAMAEYQQALAINANYAEALNNLGLALWQQGKRPEAIASLEKAKNLFTEQRRFGEAKRVEEILQKIAKDQTVSDLGYESEFG